MQPPSKNLKRKRTATQTLTQGRRARGRPRKLNDTKLIDDNASDDEVEILTPSLQRLNANVQRREKDDEKRLHKLLNGFDVYMSD